MNDNTLDFDPNFSLDGRTTIQKVRITFGKWKFRNTITIDVHSDYYGFDVFRAAIANIYDQLQAKADESIEANDRSHTATIALTNDIGEQLLCVNEDGDWEGEDWLSDMVVAAEIIAITPVAEATAT